MFHFIDYGIHPVFMLNRVSKVSYFFWKSKKFRKESTLRFFQSQVRVYVIAKKCFRRSFASPLIEYIFSSIEMANTSWNSIIYMANCFQKYVCNRNLVSKVFIAISVVFIFITDKISVTINKTSEPFKKCWFNIFLNIWKNVMKFKRSGLFKISKRLTRYGSSYFSMFSWLIKIVFKSIKLKIFDNTMRRNRINKLYGLLSYRINFPYPCFFSFFPFSIFC